MQSVSSRIWTRVAVFISYDDNDYTTGTSTPMLDGNMEYSSDSKHSDVTLIAGDDA